MTGLRGLTSFIKFLSKGRRVARVAIWRLCALLTVGTAAFAKNAALAVNLSFALVANLAIALAASTANATLAQADSPAQSGNSLSTKYKTAPEAELALNETKSSTAKKRTVFVWKFGLTGTNFQNQDERSQIIGLGLNGELRTVLLPGLLLRVKAGVSVQNGYAQSDFGDTVPRSGLGLSEAIIQYHPWQPLYFQFGAIDESYVGSAYLPAGAFPGGLQKLAIGSNQLGVDLIAQETIPTSTTLSTQTADKEKTPLYTTQGITFKLKPFEIWQLKATALHYKFDNLPSLTAFNSINYGNTILNPTVNVSSYAYNFDGFMGAASSQLTLTRGVDWLLGTNVLQNSDAPQTYRMAQWVETGFDFALPTDVNFIPKVATFFAESDVAPGFYNSSDMGHNNRRGWAASSDFVFKKKKFKFGATYSDANVINQSAYQSRQQYIQLRFESLYDLI